MTSVQLSIKKSFFGNFLIYFCVVLCVTLLVLTLIEVLNIHFTLHDFLNGGPASIQDQNRLFLGGVDMQWSPAKLLLHRINPYQYWLSGNVGKKIVSCQIPNYLHLLYILMLPIAALKWKIAKTVMWTINAALGVFVVLFLGKKQNTSLKKQLLILTIFIASLAFRTDITYGQIAIVILFFVMISFYCKSNAAYIASTSIAIVKYSFAPPLLLNEYYHNGLKRLIGVGLISVLAIFIFSLIVHENPLVVAVQPFFVSKSGVGLGVGDVMSLCRFFFPNLWYLGYALSVLLAVFLMHYYFKNKKNASVINDFAYTGLVSLACFNHLYYDYVFLLPLIFCAEQFGKIYRILTYGIITWFWFGMRILEFFSGDGGEKILHDTIPLHFILLLVAIRIFCAQRCHTRLQKHRYEHKQ